MGKGKTSTSTSKTKKVLAPGIVKGKYTHAKLASRQRKLGRGLRTGIGAFHKHILKNPTGHKDGFLLKVLANQDILKDNKKFGPQFRRLMPYHDELLSTASVHEVTGGLLEAAAANPFKPAEQAAANTLFDTMSRVRIPTKYVGYNLGGKDFMQHPTAPGSGYFADSDQTESAQAHSMHDLYRRGRATEAMEAAKSAGGNVPDVVHAGIREAIAYTLNEMAAPVTASDVQPHAKKGGAPATAQMEQVIAREKLKKAFVLLGGTQEANDAANPLDPARPWSHRRGLLKRTVSAARLPAMMVPNP